MTIQFDSITPNIVRILEYFNINFKLGINIIKHLNLPKLTKQRKFNCSFINIFWYEYYIIIMTDISDIYRNT